MQEKWREWNFKDDIGFFLSRIFRNILGVKKTKNVKFKNNILAIKNHLFSLLKNMSINWFPKKSWLSDPFSVLAHYPSFPNIVCKCTVQLALAGQKLARILKWTGIYSDSFRSSLNSYFLWLTLSNIAEERRMPGGTNTISNSSTFTGWLESTGRIQ